MNQGTSKIEERELDRLRKENELLKRWLSLASHDFRGLFANLSMLIGAFENDSISQETLLKMLPEIKQIADKNNKTVERTFEWIKTQLDGFIPHADDVVLFDLFAELGEELEERLKSKNISLIFDGDKNLSVTTDKFLLRFILKSILDNAIKYSFPQGEVKFSVVDHQNSMSVYVSDDGVGMDKEVLENLFTFTNPPYTGTMYEKGAGLSLVIARSFVNILGLGMTIKSIKESGTIVEVSFNK